MRIFVDRNIPLAASACRDLGEVVLLETTDFSRAAVRDADVLVIRSETRVGPALLEGSKVQFVGTATIGTDHIDTAYLASRGIGFASAPGSNANSVKEYVLSALLTLSSWGGFRLRNMTIGIVGVGNIGGRLAQMCVALGMNVLLNDPPLARHSGDPKYLPLDALMDADIVTLHVPLTAAGPDATISLFDEPRIAAMKGGSILLNTARGPVVDARALAGAIRTRHLSAAVIDVWEGEPEIDVELLKLVTLGTAHIAGYSLDGKVQEMKIIRSAICKHFGRSSDWDPGPEMPPSSSPVISIDTNLTEDEILRAAVHACYSVTEDDAQLRGLLTVPTAERAGYFRKLRTGYRIRREFSGSLVELPPGRASAEHLLAAAGFRIRRPG